MSRGLVWVHDTPRLPNLQLLTAPYAPAVRFPLHRNGAGWEMCYGRHKPDDATLKSLYAGHQYKPPDAAFEFQAPIKEYACIATAPVPAKSQPREPGGRGGQKTSSSGSGSQRGAGSVRNKGARSRGSKVGAGGASAPAASAASATPTAVPRWEGRFLHVLLYSPDNAFAMDRLTVYGHPGRHSSVADDGGTAIVTVSPGSAVPHVRQWAAAEKMAHAAAGDPVKLAKACAFACLVGCRGAVDTCRSLAATLKTDGSEGDAAAERPVGSRDAAVQPAGADLILAWIWSAGS